MARCRKEEGTGAVFLAYNPATRLSDASDSPTLRRAQHSHGKASLVASLLASGQTWPLSFLLHADNKSEGALRDARSILRIGSSDHQMDSLTDA